MDSLLGLMVLFFIVALVLAIFGVRGSAQAMQIAYVFLAIFIVLLVLSVLFGGSFFGGGNYFRM